MEASYVGSICSLYFSSVAETCFFFDLERDVKANLDLVGNTKKEKGWETFAANENFHNSTIFICFQKRQTDYIESFLF